MTDAEFDAKLDWIVETTIKLVREQTEYFATVFLESDDDVSIETLVAEDDEAEPIDAKDLPYSFGRRIAMEGRRPDVVFVATKGELPSGQHCIIVTGYTRDGRKNGAELVVEWAQDGFLRVIGERRYHLADASQLEQSGWECNPAHEVMSGIIRGEDVMPRRITWKCWLQRLIHRLFKR